VASETKTCPFCAETIKAAAIVCRFCGRDLLTDSASRPANKRDVFVPEDVVVAKEVLLLLDQPVTGEEIAHVAAADHTTVKACRDAWIQVETAEGILGWAEAAQFDRTTPSAGLGRGYWDPTDVSTTVSLVEKPTVTPTASEEKRGKAGRTLGGRFIGLALAAGAAVVIITELGAYSGSAGNNGTAVDLLAAVAMAPTALPVPTRLPTPTPVPPSKATAVALDPRKLAADPNAYVGENIWLQGTALNVTQNDTYTWVQLLAQVPSHPFATESIVVEFHPRDSRILSDDCYRMYGVAQGTQSVTRTLTGASNNVAVISGYAMETLLRGTYGGCPDL
jgi:hypothetical protein